MSEHTRTGQERAEEAAAKWRPWKDAEVEHRAFLHGYLAREDEVMPVDKLYVKRDAEPTTVTAGQIDAAERRGAVKALKDAAMSVNLLVSTGMGLTPSELNLIDACASGAAQGWLMAQAARIEGDEA